MSSLAFPGNPSCGRTHGLVPGILYSAVVSLAFAAVQAEWSSFDGRPALVVLDVVAGVLGLVALLAFRDAPVRVALALSALLTVSVSLTPIAGTAMLLAGRRHRLPVAIGLAVAGVAGHLVRGLWRTQPDRPFGLWIGIIAGAYAVLTVGTALWRRDS